MLTAKENELIKLVYNRPRCTPFKLAIMSNTTYSYTYKVVNRMLSKGIMKSTRNIKSRGKAISLTRVGEVIAESICVYEQNLKKAK